MKKKGFVLGAIVAILVGGYTAGIYGIAQDIMDTEIFNLEDEKAREDVAKKVLEDIGKTDVYELDTLQGVKVYYGNAVEGGTDDVIISVDFGPKNTVLAVYTPEGERYEYVGELGLFNEVKNVQFIPVEGLGKDTIVVREYSNQQLGDYETAELIRGFVYQDEKFESILKTQEKLEAVWNDAWDLTNVMNEKKWRKVIETTDVKWLEDKGGLPILDVTRYQNFLSADQEDGRFLPTDDKFKNTAQRVIKEIYYWSNDWDRFILDEATLKDTGEKVAVLEDRSASVYTLAGFQGNQYLVQFANGEQGIVDETMLNFDEK